MYRKNVASQSVFAQMNSRADGSPLTTSVSINVASPSAYGAGGGTLTHRGNGLWEYVFTQGETNYNQFGYQFTHASGVNVGGTIVPTAANPTDAAAFGLTRLDAAITSLPTSCADGLLTRDWNSVNQAGLPARCVLNALRVLRNAWDIVGGTWRVKKEDDSTVIFQKPVTETGGAVTGVGSDL